LFYLLNRHKYLLSLDDGVSQTHILNKHIEAFLVVIPNDFEEQRQIGKILFSMDMELSALESRLEKYKQVKQGMMQQLLTGKIRLV
jgi:type I restriction enzyme, S subunit